MRAKSRRWSRVLLIGFSLFLLLATAAVVYAFSNRRTTRIERIGSWFSNPASREDWQIVGGTRCGDAPMLIPSTGFIGVGWADGLPPVYEHTGLDIFSPDGADNITPIYAAYDGYLTRENDWRSTVIIRHPDFDALPEITGGEQIWTYYTHMASADGNTEYVSPEFPRGTREKFVAAGTLLGYQGTWSGRPGDPTGLHLHFSIPKTLPGGGYANETLLENTLDPTPFLGLTVDENGFIICQD